MMNINFAKGSLKFLDKLDAKQYRQVGKKILSLINNTFPNDSSKLSGYDDIFRVDCGEYRIIYSVQDNLIVIRGIGNRNDGNVYKNFDRLMK